VFTEYGEWLVASVDATVTNHDTNTSGPATVEVWDAQTGERLQTLVNTGNFRMHGLAVSPDRAFIATSRPTEAAFDIWSVETGEILYTQFGATARINSIAFNADGTLLATGGLDGKVRVWDLETRTIVATLGAFEWLVRDVVFAPDGRHVVASSRDGTVAIFTLDGQELLAIAEKRLTRELTEAECREFLHTGECPVVMSD
jgi:WD40 repeat protein